MLGQFFLEKSEEKLTQVTPSQDHLEALHVQMRSTGEHIREVHLNGGKRHEFQGDLHIFEVLVCVLLPGSGSAELERTNIAAGIADRAFRGHSPNKRSCQAEQPHTCTVVRFDDGAL